MVTFTELPWLAIGVGAIAAFALGAAWFTPVLFGKSWMRLAHPGKTMDDLQDAASPVPYVIAAVAWILAAATLGWTAAATGFAGDPMGSLRVGLYAGLGVVLPLTAMTYAFAARPGKLVLIESGYIVVGLALVGLALGILG